MTPFTAAFDAHVVAVLFVGGEAVFALADGGVRFGEAPAIAAHDGAALCMAVHPSGEGVVTGGDDGRLVWSTREEARELADIGGRWVDAVATSSASGLVAFAAGREAHVRSSADAAFGRTFTHPRAVADLAFDPKGRRLATATYGGIRLWYARIAEQRPVTLDWAGSHTAVAWSPDGRFVITATQENELHGWRVSDAQDLRMSGYPSKVRSVAFLGRGALMATSGAPGAVVWPFTGPGGPIGKEAVEIGFEEGARVLRVAAASEGFRLCAGLADGRIWSADLRSTPREVIKSAGAPISALAVAPGGDALAWGDEAGGAGVIALG